MKLATLKTGTRDGELLVVSQNLLSATRVPDIAPTMQAALDNWVNCSAHLQEVYCALNSGNISQAFPFDASAVHSPLPRAYQWADGSAYVNHVELVRKARGAKMPEQFWTDPLMYQGGSDSFIGPKDNIYLADEAWGIDFEAEITVVTNDVPMGVSPEEAGQYIALFMLVNDVSLRNLIPNEIGKGFGFFHSKPSSAFTPVAVTPSEFGKSWDGKKLHLPLISTLNNKRFGEPNAGVDMTFDFPTLIAHAAKTRPLSSGTIIGSGTVSNVDRSKGSSCIAEKRMLETIENGKPTTEFMKFGDTIRIEMQDTNQQDIFGCIEQTVVKYEKQ